MHLLSLFNIKHVLLLAFLFLSQSFAFNSFTYASTLYEETNSDKLHTKVSKLDLNKERQEVLPPEMIIAIFDSYPAMLPKVARINHDWHQFAQPKLSAYTKIFNKIGILSRDNTRWTIESYTNAFINLVFQKSSFDGETQLQYYKHIRKHISDSINIFNKDRDELFIDNPGLLDTEIPIDHGTSFNLSKLLRAWSELQIHKSAVIISKELWSATKILESSFDTKDTLLPWYTRLHKPTPGNITDRTWMMKFIVSEAERHKDEFPSSGFEVLKLLYQFIEFDKLALAANHKEQEFYSEYPSYNVMKAFQAVPVDLNHNTDEDRVIKLELLKSSILTFVKKHIGPMEFYIALIKHQLARG